MVNQHTGTPASKGSTASLATTSHLLAFLGSGNSLAQYAKLQAPHRVRNNHNTHNTHTNTNTIPARPSGALHASWCCLGHEVVSTSTPACSPPRWQAYSWRSSEGPPAVG